MRLLVAENDPHLLKSLVHIFEINQFTVDGVSDGKDVLDYAQSGEYDGLIMELKMPDMDGIQVLKSLREMKIVIPAMLLSENTKGSRCVEGLNAGADDYMAKPFRTDELLARVHAMLRRKEVFIPNALTFYGMTLDRSGYVLAYKEKKQPLSRKEFQIMEVLASNLHIMVTTEQMMTRIWGWNTNVNSSVISVHMSNIRKKLAAMEAPVCIRFQRGVGYIIEEVS